MPSLLEYVYIAKTVHSLSAHCAFVNTRCGLFNVFLSLICSLCVLPVVMPARCWWLCVSLPTSASFSVVSSSDSSRRHPAFPTRLRQASLDYFPLLLNKGAMFFHRCQMMVPFTVCFLLRTVVYSIKRCGLGICRDDENCCVPVNDTTAATCCKQFLNPYYNIAMVTRKLSGVLILLLLFAVGYFIQRVLCSRSSQVVPPPAGHPMVTTSQEPLVESCVPDSSMDPAPAAAQLPTYDECKRLPTYEETVRDDLRRGRQQCSLGNAT